MSILSRLVLISSLFLGCSPETEILSGWWYSRPLSETVDQSVLPDIGFSLAIGHYGPDVAGTVRLVQGEFESDEFKGHNRPIWEVCPCTYLENGYYRGGSFSFRIEDSPDCSLLDTLGVASLVVELKMEGENRMEGILATRSGENVQPIVFVRDEEEDYIRESEKQCSGL